MEEKQFCPLCAKHYSGEPSNITLGAVSPGNNVMVKACKSCEKVIHNASRLFTEALRQFRQTSQEQFTKEEGLKDESRILAPPPGLARLLSGKKGLG